MKFSLATAFALLVALQAVTVDAHSVLVFPTARDGSKTSDYGDKQAGAGTSNVSTAKERATCGLAPNPGAIKASFKPGSKITVVWKTTIPHDSAPGVRIAIAEAPGLPFTLLTPIDAQGYGPSIDLEKYQVTLPNKELPNAVLQYIWDSYADGGFYLECADIKISSSVTTNSVYDDGTSTTAPPVDTTPTDPAPSTPVTKSPAASPAAKKPSPSPAKKGTAATTNTQNGSSSLTVSSATALIAIALAGAALL